MLLSKKPKISWIVYQDLELVSMSNVIAFLLTPSAKHSEMLSGREKTWIDILKK